MLPIINTYQRQLEQHVDEQRAMDVRAERRFRGGEAEAVSHRTEMRFQRRKLVFQWNSEF
jgi:hypothetical protein